MARELVPGVWQFDLGLVSPLASNAFLVDEAELPDGRFDGQEPRSEGDDVAGNDADVAGDHADDGDGAPAVTLCDAGLRWNRPSIRAELADAGYAVDDLDRVLVTHYDLDHVGGLSALLPEFTGPVFVGRPDHALLTGEDDPSLTHHKGVFHRISRRLFPLPDGLDVRPIDDGERVGRFSAFLTPGHNPGHVVYIHDAGVALLGDLVWEEQGALTTPFWLDSYDMRQVHRSLTGLVERAPPFDVAAMGHGTPLVSGGDDALRALTERL